MKLRIATRGSHLALAQTYFVEKKLRGLGIETEIIIIKTTGDINYSSFEEIASKGDETKGLFTKEIEEALLRGVADIAVHSLKDLPTKIPEELYLAALPERLDFRDYWIYPKHKKIQNEFPFVKKNALIGTSSLRRKSLLRYHLPGAKFLSIRGNLPTRIKKLFIEKELDVILLSGAGIQRLSGENDWLEENYLQEIEIYPLDPEIFPNAPGQGTLAVECRKKDTQIIEILKKIHDNKIEDIISIERGILKNLEGGCHLPLGVHAKKVNNDYQAVVFLGEEYPYAKKKRDIFIKRFHQSVEKLIEFITEELTSEFQIVVMGNKNKNQTLKRKFSKVQFLDVLEINYYNEFIKKFINKNNKISKILIYAIFSAEAIRSLHLNSFRFPLEDFFVVLNGKKSKEVFLDLYPEVPKNKILLSEDGTAVGSFQTIQKLFDIQTIEIKAITGKDSRNEFFQLIKEYDINCENWIVYESNTKNLSKEEIEKIPRNAVIIFGSPSIFDAFEKSLINERISFSENWKFITLGDTTFQHIKNKGYSVYAKSHEPDYEKIIHEFL